MKIKEIRKDIKGIFRLPIKKYYFGGLRYGTPYFYPINFNSTILTIRKLNVDKNNNFSNMPIVLRNKYWIPKIFGQSYYIEIGFPISINNIGLGWKDKWRTPRCEWIPMFQLNFFLWQLCIFYESPDGKNELYYEMILWYLHYNNKDIIKAKNTWMWINDKKENTWNEKYLI